LKPPRADTVLVNGRIFTAIAERPFVEAIAVDGELISAVGTSDSILRLATPETRVIDLQGRVATPGFNDAHTHFQPDWLGRNLKLSGMEPTAGEALAAVREAVLHEKPGTIISGAIGGDAFFSPECTPEKLTEIAPVHPVILRTWTPHAAIMNRAMSDWLGVDEEAPPVLGGFFGKDMSGMRWDGVVHEYEAMKIHRKLHDLAIEEPQLRKMLEDCARWGVTSIQLMSLPNDAARIVELLSAMGPHIRVRVIPMPLTDIGGRRDPEYPSVPAEIAARVRVDGVKWLLDGTPIERSSAELEGYLDDPGRSGATDFSGQEMRSILRDARLLGEQLMVHVVGSRTTADFVDAMDETGGPEVWAEERVRIEHADGMVPDQIPLVKKQGAVVVVNPTHLAVGPLLIRRLGPDVAKDRQAVRSIMEAGIPLAIGSDGETNPFLNLMFITTHERRPDQALTMEQAVTLYTAGSAFAEFEEDRKGTIEVGKLADIAVLSDDIFSIPPQDLPRTESVLTMVGGTIIRNRFALRTRAPEGAQAPGAPW
jgi:predicted amidohydrolase YtcJ